MSVQESSENFKSEETSPRKEQRSDYYSDPYLLECQALRNGFGKMVNARNQSNPIYSFSKQPRFFTPQKKDNYFNDFLENQIFKNINISYNSNKKSNYTNSESDYKNPSTSRNDLNNFLYQNIKYPYVPKWSFSKSERPSSGKKNTYEFYKIPYDKNSENEKYKKKWVLRIIGGDIGEDKRFNINKNSEDSEVPGPGKYNPNYCYFKYKKNNYGYMGIKTEDNSVEISPVSYNNNLQIGSDVNNFKFSNGPKFLFSKSKRNFGRNKKSLINERYLKYSSFGEQIMAQKDTRPIYSFNKGNRFSKFKNSK